jgi:NhaP-type Na+/H+ or K+/H+ antiporter
MALYSRGKGVNYKNYSYDWTTGDMFVTLCAGIAIGVTVGMLVAYITFN